MFIYMKMCTHRHLQTRGMLVSAKLQLNRKEIQTPLKMREGHGMQINYAEKFK